ncbi:hypothetical protein CXB51_005282 [Gossypium anomalum]|uniref:Aminotransferase-like plant mobile domain-containing protein n=1 Tax=Gossypium anomalum TaxID=47600 RepID=A0A8J5ZC25_9ROSI|nr:hypothetical protein CXB51_005282 [Gossypium anomalum]
MLEFYTWPLLVGGVNWTPILVSVLMERWRLEMHTFHLPCDECTIALKDVQLQLRLPVDGSVVAGAQIDMNWLRRNFGGLDKELTKVQREQHARVYILMIIEGLLMPDRMHLVGILGQSQHLAREGAIGSVRYSGDARVR